MRPAFLSLHHFLGQELWGPHTPLSHTHCFTHFPKLPGFYVQLGLPLLNKAKKIYSILSFKLCSSDRVIQWESNDSVSMKRKCLTCHHPFKFHNRDFLPLLFFPSSRLKDEFKIGIKGKTLSFKEKCCRVCLWSIPEGTWGRGAGECFSCWRLLRTWWCGGRCLIHPCSCHHNTFLVAKKNPSM